MLAFDIESTGLDPLQDRIVELAFVEVTERRVVFHEVVNPGVSISASAQDVHGLSKEDVEGRPFFREFAAEVQRLIEGHILVGYASREFDSIMLDAELRRAGEAGLPLGSIDEIDLYSVWQRLEPRTLTGAVQRFVGKEHVDAHTAKADAAVLPALLEAMRREWGVSVEEMAALTVPDGVLDQAGRLQWDEDLGDVVFNFGQYDGEPIRLHQDYLEWMLEKDFPASTKRVIRMLQESGFENPHRGPGEAADEQE